MSPWDTVDATHERLGCAQGVPDAADGVDEGRAKGGVDLLAQVAKVDVDCYRLSTLTLPGTVRVPGACEERNGRRPSSQGRIPGDEDVPRAWVRRQVTHRLGDPDGSQHPTGARVENHDGMPAADKDAAAQRGHRDAAEAGHDDPAGGGPAPEAAGFGGPIGGRAVQVDGAQQGSAARVEHADRAVSGTDHEDAVG